MTARACDMIIAATTPWSVTVLVSGREYTYLIDGLHIPGIERKARRRPGAALADLKRLAWGVETPDTR